MLGIVTDGRSHRAESPLFRSSHAPHWDPSIHSKQHDMLYSTPPSHIQMPDSFIYLGPSQEANSLQNRYQKMHALP